MGFRPSLRRQRARKAKDAYRPGVLVCRWARVAKPAPRPTEANRRMAILRMPSCASTKFSKSTIECSRVMSQMRIHHEHVDATTRANRARATQGKGVVTVHCAL
jgi:cell division septum initiation protein DivIVA